MIHCGDVPLGPHGNAEMPDARTSMAVVPTKPGVYLLKDAAGRVIYVGKAANLRSRLRAYTGATEPDDPKGRVLRSRMTDFEYIVTESETEALILESNLIKEHRPRYNVKLRDDKKYPFIKVTVSEDFPKAYVTRLVKDDGSRYFGPYTDAKAMRRTLRLIRQIFPVRQCKTFRFRPRPCLNYQIGRCLGPCRGDVSKDEYAKVVRQLCLFLSGHGGEAVELLEREMARAVHDLRFEDAARLRDRMADIDKVLRRQRVLTTMQADRDAVAVARFDRYGVASVARVRRGKLVACENCSLDFARGTSDGEVLETFLKQFYAMARDVPSEILVDRDPPDAAAIEAWLSERTGRKVALRTPMRGEKRLLIDFARENASQALRRSFESRRPPKVVVELGEFLGTSRPPRLVSAVDVSNFGGSLAVGTVVTLRDGKPDKALYRRYRIRTVKGIDDCGMIREVVRRHLARCRKGDCELPDALLVDGGKGQLSAASEALRESGLKGVALIALAKREEQVFVPGQKSPLTIPQGSRAKRLLERARNEAHRFSVTYHRSLRTKVARESALDAVPGVGPARKRQLLARFGSVHAIAECSPEELAEVPGIGTKTANRIKAALAQAARRNRAGR